jgi:GT2 family glycosyltransferase
LDSNKITVIVPAYNATSLLAQCLESLLDQQSPSAEASPPDLEIIVVDDGSSNQTAAIVGCYASQGVRLLRQAHRGAAAARNSGVKAARPASSIILFTDADCIPDPFWAARLVAALQSADSHIVGIKGAYRTCQKSKVARFVQAEFQERYDRFQQRQLEPEFADTYAAAYRREALEQHPFDETLPGAIVEDAELGWRLRQLGYHFGFEPAAIVYHQHAARPFRYFRRKFRIGRWRVAIYRRYPGQVAASAHTSQLAKFQMLLLALTGATLGTTVLLGLIPARRKLARFTLLATSLIFGTLQLSYAGFLKRLLRQRDLDLVLVGWLLLNLRSAALTGGAILGVGQLALEKLLGESYGK